MICTTKFYEKGVAQNYSHGYKYVDDQQIIIDETNITKDFRNTPITKDNYKDYIYDYITLKDGLISDEKEKLKYEFIDEVIPNKSFQGFILTVYGVPDKLNNMINYYRILLDEIEYENNKEEYKRIIIGNPIEKYIHGPCDTNNIEDYEMEIIIPYKWET